MMPDRYQEMRPVYDIEWMCAGTDSQIRIREFEGLGLRVSNGSVDCWFLAWLAISNKFELVLAIFWAKFLGLMVSVRRGASQISTHLYGVPS